MPNQLPDISLYPFYEPGNEAPYRTGDQLEYKQEQVRGRYPSHDIIDVAVSNRRGNFNNALLVNYAGEILYPYLISGIVPVANNEVLLSRYRAGAKAASEGTFIPHKLMDWVSETQRDRFMRDRRNHISLMQKLFVDLSRSNRCPCQYPRILDYVQKGLCKPVTDAYFDCFEVDQQAQFPPSQKYDEIVQLRCPNCGSTYLYKYTERGDMTIEAIKIALQQIGAMAIQSPPRYLHYRYADFRGWDWTDRKDRADTSKQVYDYLLAK